MATVLVKFTGNFEKEVTLRLHRINSVHTINGDVVLSYGTAPKLSYFGIGPNVNADSVSSRLSALKQQYPAPEPVEEREPEENIVTQLITDDTI